MANSNRDRKDSASTSSSREESGGMRGSPSGSENQGDGFETGNARQGGMSGAGTGDRNTRRDSGLDDSRDRGMSGSSGSTGLGGESPDDATSPPGGVEGTSTRDGREDLDRESRR